MKRLHYPAKQVAGKWFCSETTVIRTKCPIKFFSRTKTGPVQWERGLNVKFECDFCSLASCLLNLSIILVELKNCHKHSGNGVFSLVLLLNSDDTIANKGSLSLKHQCIDQNWRDRCNEIFLATCPPTSRERSYVQTSNHCNSALGKISFLLRYFDDSFRSVFVSTMAIDHKVTSNSSVQQQENEATNFPHWWVVKGPVPERNSTL